jgi:hypothetical protein
MKTEILVAVGSLVVAISSLAVAVYSAITSSRTAKTQADVQARMLALESVRQRAETRASKQAKVAARIVGDGSDVSLIVHNSGPVAASGITLTFDGGPPSKHPVWLGGQTEITTLGPGADAKYLLAVAQQSPDVVVVEVSWENPSGERDVWSSQLRL